MWTVHKWQVINCAYNNKTIARLGLSLLRPTNPKKANFASHSQWKLCGRRGERRNCVYLGRSQSKIATGQKCFFPNSVVRFYGHFCTLHKCPFYLKLQLCNSKIWSYSFCNFNYRDKLQCRDQIYKFVTSKYIVLWPFHLKLQFCNSKICWSYSFCNFNYRKSYNVGIKVTSL